MASRKTAQKPTESVATPRPRATKSTAPKAAPTPRTRATAPVAPVAAPVVATGNHNDDVRALLPDAFGAAYGNVASVDPTDAVAMGAMVRPVTNVLRTLKGGDAVRLAALADVVNVAMGEAFGRSDMAGATAIHAMGEMIREQLAESPTRAIRETDPVPNAITLTVRARALALAASYAAVAADTALTALTTDEQRATVATAVMEQVANPDVVDSPTFAAFLAQHVRPLRLKSGSTGNGGTSGIPRAVIARDLARYADGPISLTFKGVTYAAVIKGDVIITAARPKLASRSFDSPTAAAQYVTGRGNGVNGWRDWTRDGVTLADIWPTL